MAKTRVFEGLGIDIEGLSADIRSHLAESGFEVAHSEDRSGKVPVFFIQARKRGMLRTTTGMRRSTDIRIEGVPNYFEIKVGTGEWGNNIIASAPLFVIPIVGITTTAARIYTAKRFESGIWKYITRQIAMLQGRGGVEQERPEDVQYYCDYVGGYQGWDTPVLGGTVRFENEASEAGRLIFRAPDGEQITIPGPKIEKASILAGSAASREDHTLLEITHRGRGGGLDRLILSIPSEKISNIMTGVGTVSSKIRRGSGLAS